MKYQKITKLLDTAPDNVPRFITKKWVEVHDQSNNIYNTNKQIRFKTSMLQSDLCDYSDAYIVVKGTITVEVASDGDKYNSSLILKNNAAFISCISKINNRLIGNAEDLDVVMPMYNLTEYSKNYSKTSGSLWNYYRDEPNNPLLNPPVNNNPPTLNYNADLLKQILYNFCSITGKTGNDRNTKDVAVIVPSKPLSNSWRTLDIPLINCEVNLILTWYENCVLTDLITRDAEGDNPAIPVPTNATFKITDTKLHAPVVTVSTQDDNKLLKQSKTGFKRTIKWKKYRSEITNQSKTDNLNYLMNPHLLKSIDYLP